MVWFRVDDRFHASEPVKKIPADIRLAAVGLWTIAGAWSSQFLKDGDVPAHIVEDLDATHLADALVKCGLWKKRRGGYVFRDWSEWQPTRAGITKKREDQNARVAAWRNKKAENPTDTGESNASHESIAQAPKASVSASRPDPTRPDPTNKEEKAEKRGTRIPDGFAVTPAMTQWAKTNTPTVDTARATEKFINYWTAKAGAQAVKLDWTATWRNWMLSDQERSSTTTGRRTPTTKAQQNAEKYFEIYGADDERTRSIQAADPGISER